MVRLGVIGCGKIHSTHCDAIGGVENASLAAVFDTDRAVAKLAGERYEVPAPATIEEFYQLVDAVNVCVPSGLHAEVAIHAAQHGKHALVEKPIEVNLCKAQALVGAFRDRNLKLGVVSQHRFASKIQRLREAAHQGELGRPLQGDAIIKWYRTQSYYDSGDWRGTWNLDGGGCLMNQGVHYIDMIQWIMGGAKAVQAQVRTAAHTMEVEDMALAIVEYKNGAIGIIQGSTCAYPGFAERIEVHGTDGSVIVEGDRVKFWDIDPEGANQGYYGGGVMMQPTPSRHISEMKTEEVDASSRWGEQHRLQIQDFVDAITNDRDPFMTGEMALEPLKVILAIYESARNGGVRVEIT